MQSYKVFINNFHILFSENFNINNNDNLIVNKDDVYFFDVYEEFMYFFENEKTCISNNIVLNSQNAYESFFRFKENFLCVSAAGGVVKNRFQEILFIHKNNIWDLPKGKIEAGEKPIETAKREVFEETNVSGAQIINSHIYSTYHIYRDKFNCNRLTLKETQWVFMESNFNSILKPQIKEGIIDVKWFSYRDIRTLNTYASIIDPLNFFL